MAPASLSATLFSLLIAATNFPIVYMGFIDGQAYTSRGIPGAFLADAGLSLAAYFALGALLIRLRSRSFPARTPSL